MCCSQRKAARRALALAAVQGAFAKSTDRTPLVVQEKGPLALTTNKASDAASIISAPPSYTVATAKSQSGPYDIAPREYQPLPAVAEVPVISEGARFITANLTPAQLACPHHDRRRRFGAAGIVGGVLFFPWGLFWTFCDSRYECKLCGANLGKYGDGRLDTCGGTSCGRANRAAVGYTGASGGCGGRPRCGTCGRRRCRRGCAGYGTAVY